MKLTAIVDPNPPSIEAKIEGDQVWVKITDLETPENEPLFLQARRDDGEIPGD